MVIGAGPIGMVTALEPWRGAGSRVIMADVQQPKLDLAATLGPITPVNGQGEKTRRDVVRAMTEGWGRRPWCSRPAGTAKAAAGVFEPLLPGGKVVFIGMPWRAGAHRHRCAHRSKQARIETIFRYAHVYPRALALMGSGKIDVKPLVTNKFHFAESVKAFDFRQPHARRTGSRAQIEME